MPIFDTTRLTLRQMQTTLGSYLWPGGNGKGINFVKIREMHGQTGKLQGYVAMDMAGWSPGKANSFHDLKGDVLLMDDKAYVFLNVQEVKDITPDQAEIMVVPAEKLWGADNINIYNRQLYPGHQPTLTWRVADPNKATLVYEPLQLQAGEITQKAVKKMGLAGTWVYPRMLFDPKNIDEIIQHEKTQNEKKLLMEIAESQPKTQSQSRKL